MRFADSDHPDRAAHVAVEGYEGPLGLLLGLIEQRELDILEVPLGDLAGAYLEALTVARRGADVAHQLVRDRCQPAHPHQEPRHPAAPAGRGHPRRGWIRTPRPQLRERLILYRMYRDAGRDLKGRLESGWEVFRREPIAAVASAKAGSRPDEGPPLDPQVLVAALDRCAATRCHPAAAARCCRAAPDHARGARSDHPHRR